MTETPQMAAYRHMPPTDDGRSILKNGGTWKACDPFPPIEDYETVPETVTFQVHHFKARPRGRFGRVWHEVYSVETGEVVGRIN